MMVNNSRKILTKRRRRLALVRMKGGLGNQLFQLSLVRYLESVGYRVLVDDISGYAKDPYGRRPILDALGLRYCSTRASIPKVLTGVSVLLSKGMFRYLAREQHYLGHLTDYNAAGYFSSDLSSNYLLCDGYFQNESELGRFYKRVAQELRLSRRSAPPSPGAAQAQTGLVNYNDSVGVHLRVDQPSGVPEGSAARADYLGRMITRVKEELWHHRNKCPFRQAVVFSDSEELVASLVSEFAGYCIGAPRDTILKPEVNDFTLLSKCAKRILTPSTFGWWAAASSESRGHDDCMITLPETSLMLPSLNREVG
jgi:hypothetical protein